MVKAGYKQTEIGVIPEDWELTYITEIMEYMTDYVANGSFESLKNNVTIRENPDYAIYVRLVDIRKGLGHNTQKYVDKNSYDFLKKSNLIGNEILIANIGENVGETFLMPFIDKPATIAPNMIVIKLNQKKVIPSFCFSYLKSQHGIQELNRVIEGSGQPKINKTKLKTIKLIIPPKEEQKAIASTLSDVDALITSLEKLIAKKESIKTATMQQLLTGKKRLDGFSGKWEVSTIENIAINLDNLRVPLNENQRSKMKGDIPYCGANGIVGYVNDYVIDDDILLMAEDGGYFDEYATRPIVYRMIGKCWVNNHAHILKSKNGFNQDYLFYSLVHKDITKFLTSGTRAKLNKSEMYKIEVFAPKDIKEQQAIAQILSDMDNEIEALKTKLTKTKAIKDGMMSELLSGKTRLLHQEKKAISQKHNQHFEDAVIIGTLTKLFATESFPLGRKRYTKLSYLLHRYKAHSTENYLKKAAGPYNPITKYGGAENIALKKQFVTKYKNSQYEGFVAADNNAEATSYFYRWFGDDGEHWIEQFRFMKNDELELLATVDMAVQDLIKVDEEVNLINVKKILGSHKEWKAKLKRDIFSDDNIKEAIEQANNLFGV